MITINRRENKKPTTINHIENNAKKKINKEALNVE